MRKTAVLTAVAVVFTAGVGAAIALLADFPSARGPVSPHPVWHEVQWPFPIDPWGKGKAFRCKAADCGAEVNLFVRAKIGFCNCATGVSDDQELDRISDFDLLSQPVKADGPGRPIDIAWMKGRSRAFATGPANDRGAALSVGFNDRCDAIVATAVLKREQVEAMQSHVIEFLNTPTVLRWAEVTLGL